MGPWPEERENRGGPAGFWRGSSPAARAEVLGRIRSPRRTCRGAWWGRGMVGTVLPTTSREAAAGERRRGVSSEGLAEKKGGLASRG